MPENYDSNINVIEVAVSTVAIDLDLVRRLSKARKIPEQEIIKMLTHNVFSVNQFALLIGKAYQTINNMTRLKIKEGSSNSLTTRRDLTICYPFSIRDKDGVNHGPKFVYRDQSAMARIERSIK